MHIKPFRGVRYNTKKIGNLSKVICPPYDVINKQQQKEYIAKSSKNIVSIVLPDGKNRSIGHKKAKSLLHDWLNNGVLLSDETPCIYVYQQTFKIGNAVKTRTGFLSLLEIEGKKSVLPHEKIFDKFKFERFNLMKTTQAHLSPIFMFFNDNDRKVEKLLKSVIRSKKPVANINFNGVNEKLWSISERTFIDSISRSMFAKKAFIADGHHRFAASTYLKDYMAQKQMLKSEKMPYDYTLAYFSSMQDNGLAILPTHRAIKYLPDGFSKELMLKKLSNHFSVKVLKSKNSLIRALEAADKKGEHAFGFFYDNSFIYAELTNKRIIKDIGPSDNSLYWKKLDVSILHYFTLPNLLNIKEKVKGRRNIYYYKGKTEAIKMVKTKKMKMAIFLNSTKIKEVEQVAKAGNKMPHKSTYFYPKLLTGLVIHKF